MKDARITVRLPIALRRQLKRTAITEGVRESDLIRDAVERRVGEKDAIVTAYDRAKKAGIIGIVRDTPPDLSTNKKHFDGFGK
jgi:metal-responsive CopG/Arc/MetJ family transcriptional regulator